MSHTGRGNRKGIMQTSAKDDGKRKPGTRREDDDNGKDKREKVEENHNKDRQEKRNTEESSSTKGEWTRNNINETEEMDKEEIDFLKETVKKIRRYLDRQENKQ